MAKKKILTRSEIMSKVHSKDTKPELILRKALWAKGYRYRKNVTKIYGKPDIAFLGKKIAIFCDSEYWHGKHYLKGKRIPSTNRDYWVAKFERNIARDKKVNTVLKEQEWIVLRYWEEDIYKNLESIIDDIEKHFEDTK